MANCKQGDIAIGVNAVPEKARNIGAVVRVLEVYQTWPLRWRVEMLSHAYYDGALRPPGTLAIAQDFYLRPLRDGGGVDEVLVLAGLPVDCIGV